MCRARLAVLLLLTLPSTAFAEDGEATRTIRLADARARELLASIPGARGHEASKLEEALARETRALFDGRELARNALATHWDTLAPSVRDEIAALLEVLVVRAQLEWLRANSAFRVEYVGETAEGDATLVRTTVHIERKRRPAAVEVHYLLRRAGAHWRVHDLRTDGVSLVANYRSRFNRTILREGVQGLVAALRRKAAENP